MQTVKYIFVNDTRSKNDDRAMRRRVSDFKRYILVNSHELSHEELVNRLVSLRFRHPNAKILGLSEIEGECICASEAMNQLRRELSEWP